MNYETFFRNVVQLEKYAYMTKELYCKLKDKEKELRKKDYYRPIIKPLTKYFDTLSHTCVVCAILYGLIGILTTSGCDVIPAIIFGPLYGAVLGVVVNIPVFIIARTVVSNNNKKEEAYAQQHNANEDKRIAYSIKSGEIGRIIQLQNKVAKEYNATIKLIDSYYNKGNIYAKYRNIVAACSFYEYFAARRCSSLEGHEGAYNIFETESRLERIIVKLDIIISKLDQIKENQYQLYNAIQESNQKLSMLYQNSVKQIKLAEYSANNTAIAAESARQAAQQAELSNWLTYCGY